MTTATNLLKTNEIRATLVIVQSNMCICTCLKLEQGMRIHVNVMISLKPFMKLLDPLAHNDQECTDFQKFTNKMCLAVLFFR